jgi:hypothetical protein
MLDYEDVWHSGQAPMADEQKIVPMASPSAMPPDYVNDPAKAAVYRRELASLLDSVCHIMTTARRDGLFINFRIETHAGGQAYVPLIEIMRPL